MQVSSVTGRVDRDDLGVVLPHEHLHMQFDCVFKPHPQRLGESYRKGNDGFHLSNLGLLRQYPYSSPYNLKLNDSDSQSVILNELETFKIFGGKTIVENTTHGISRNASLLKKWSLESGVLIVAGTGYYVACSQTASALRHNSEFIEKHMVEEITNGCDEDKSVQCGIIGELGISWPIENFEKNVITAAAAAQEILNIPVSFHPGRSPLAPFEILRIFTEAGGKPNGVVMSHIDRTLLKEEDVLKFAELGTYIQYDLFGTECSYYQIAEEIDMPSDSQRIDRIRLLIDEGYLSKVTMSHDIHTKHRLASFGGHGFAHILSNVVPKMKNKGFKSQELTHLLEVNPQDWLLRKLSF